MTIIDQISNETLVAVVTTGAAVVSAVAAWRSQSIAKEAFRIARLDHRERHDDLKPYLIDGFSWKSRNGEKYVLFAMSITNSANAPESLVRVELKVYAYDSNGNSSHVILEPTPEIITDVIPWSLEPLASPLNLNPRHTVSGWIGFKLPKLFTTSKTIERYEIVGITATGIRVVTESYLLRTVIDERTKD